jgi:hypothetical protein
VRLEPIPGRIAADPGHRLHGWRPSWVRATAPDAAHREAGSRCHPRHQRRRDGAEGRPFRVLQAGGAGLRLCPGSHAGFTTEIPSGDSCNRAGLRRSPRAVR